MTDRPDAAGCVVYRYDEHGRPFILLIHDQYGKWTLPKGHLDDGEEAQEAAVREVREETGMTGALGPFVASITYMIQKKGRPYRKRVDFFLMRADDGEAVPQNDEGISAVAWLPPDEAQMRAGYHQIRNIIARATEMIPPP